MATKYQEAQTRNPDSLIYLIEIDLKPIGVNLSDYYCVYENEEIGQGAYLDGRHFRPWPIQMNGFDSRSKGTLPRPELLFSDANKVVSALLAIYKPRHAAVRRRKIYRRHLDDGIDPNPLAEFEPEEYILDRWDRDLVSKLYLVTDLEHLNTQVPARKIIDIREGH